MKLSHSVLVHNAHDAEREEHEGLEQEHELGELPGDGQEERQHVDAYKVQLLLLGAGDGLGRVKVPKRSECNGIF